MFTLYIGNKNYSSWSLRPWLVLRALGVPFEERLLRFDDAAAWAEFRAWSPSGKVPLLVDGERQVWDSLAIVEYVAERHAGVWPADAGARAWARSAAAEMHSGFSMLRQRCGMNVGVRVRLHELPSALQADIDRVDALFVDGLGRFGGPWLAGAGFSAVDAFFAPVAFRVQTYGLQLSAPARAYVDRLLAHPDVVAWAEAGLAESFRDEEHDADCRAAGEWTADYRASP